MKLSDAIEGFFICKTGNRKGDFSPKTIRLYQHLLRNLTKTLNDPEIETITSRDLERFMAALAKPERKLSPFAQDNYYKAIRSFFNWAVDSVNAQPAHKALRQPIVIAEPVIPFSKQDIKRILAACEFTTRTSPVSRKPYTQSRPTETRDKTIIYLLLDTGLRIGELSRLTMEDIFLDHGTLRVVPYHTGKKSRPREIPFGR
jgi:integrase/recombinase XerD